MALEIVALHIFQPQHPNDKQLLMGIFGEGGTGKSRVIDAIRQWFLICNCSNQLSIMATTGTAAIKIRGTTVHSAIGIGVDDAITRIYKPSDKRMKEWSDTNYIIVDEVSMMDSKLICMLHSQLGKLKSSPDKKFGGVNVIFVGDFLQLPTVTRLDLYLNKSSTQQAHLLWRSIHTVVILHQQMRQAEDHRYAEMLSRLRIRSPTDEDIILLNGRVGAPIPDTLRQNIVTIVRRHSLRHALNIHTILDISKATNMPITYCIADVLDRSDDITDDAIHDIRYHDTPVSLDVILPLVPGAPLLVTKNINARLGMFPIVQLLQDNTLTLGRPGQRRLCHILWVCRHLWK
jgi:hypothetical protein